MRLTGPDVTSLKLAAEEVVQALAVLPGVLDAEDDMPWGREQLIYQVSPWGEALGLTTTDLGRQLRAAFDGRVAQIYQDGRDEMEVLAVEVSASLNTDVSTTSDVIASLEAEALPAIVSRYNVRYSFEGRSADQRETIDDMKTGLIIGVALMYVV